MPFTVDTREYLYESEYAEELLQREEGRKERADREREETSGETRDRSEVGERAQAT